MANISLDDFKINIINKRFVKTYFVGNAWELSLDFKDYGKTWELAKEKSE